LDFASVTETIWRLKGFSADFASVTETKNRPLPDALHPRQGAIC